LLATKDLEERIAPLFRRWEEVRKENDDLRDRLNVLHGESVAAKEKAKKARTAIQDEREESQRLAQKVDTYKTVLKGRDGEVAKLKAELEERDKKVWPQLFFLIFFFGLTGI
jgi:chromosome segregation ATPase